MIRTLLTFVLLLCCSWVTINASNYPQNKAPLAEVPFIALPVGAVHAEGWLHTQLLLQKDGLTGQAEVIYNSKNDLGPDNDWLGGTGDSWERAPYYTKGLVALAYVLDDAELKEKAQKWIDWSLDNQRASGFFGPANNPDWWARMPMLYAIRDYYDATGDQRVIPFFTRYFRYQNTHIESLPLSSWGKSRAGDNMEIIYWLYNRTGDAFLLQLADKLHKQAYPWTKILSGNLFNQFTGDFQPKHNVNIPQAIKMPAIYSQRSHSEADRQAYFLGWEHLMRDHGQPMGMAAGSEMVCGVSSMTGIELCSVVEQMQSSQTAQMILGSPCIGDQLEKVAFNALPGGLTADIKGMQYYQLANQVISKHGYTGFAQNYDNGHMPGPFSGYGCCRFDFHMGYPYFVKTMWAATADNGLAVMAYGPSRVTAKVGSGVEVSIREQTNYPFDERLRFTITTAENVRFPLKFRIPAWCDAPEIKVNGVAETAVLAGTFHSVLREWSDNDVVSIYFPMPLQLTKGVNGSVSIQRGPLVFSLKIEEEWVVRNAYGNGFNEYEVLPASSWNYALLLDKKNLASSIGVVQKPMPENPFEQSATPVELKVAARKVADWGYNHSGRLAVDPPVHPKLTDDPAKVVTLIPYGAQTLRATSLPYVQGGTHSCACNSLSCTALAGKSLMSTEFSETYDQHPVGWVEYGGSWFVKNGQYHAGSLEASHRGSKSVQTSTFFADFIYEADVQLLENQGDAGLLFRASKLSFGPDDFNGYYVGISSAAQQLVLGRSDGSWRPLASVSFEALPSVNYRLKVEAKGSLLKVYVDDMQRPLIEITDNAYSSGAIGVRSFDAMASWDNLKVRKIN